MISSPRLVKLACVCAAKTKSASATDAQKLNCTCTEITAVVDCSSFFVWFLLFCFFLFGFLLFLFVVGCLPRLGNNSVTPNVFIESSSLVTIVMVSSYTH